MDEQQEHMSAGGDTSVTKYVDPGEDGRRELALVINKQPFVGWVQEVLLESNGPKETDTQEIVDAATKLADAFSRSVMRISR